MKNITGEVAIRGFFGSATKNEKIYNNKTINQEITWLFLDCFEWTVSTFF